METIFIYNSELELVHTLENKSPQDISLILGRSVADITKHLDTRETIYCPKERAYFYIKTQLVRKSTPEEIEAHNTEHNIS